MSTLAVVEEVLREIRRPVSVREIVELSGERLPTRSKTPDTVVARDLSMDIKRHGAQSRFIRTEPGRYTMREFVETSETIDIVASSLTSGPAGVRSSRPSPREEGLVAQGAGEATRRSS